MTRKVRTDGRPVMILDFNRCVRVSSGDEVLARPTTPYTCDPCLTDGSVSAKLRFDGSPIPVCEDHAKPIEMVEVV